MSSSSQTAEPARGASTVDDEIEVGYNEQFETSWRHIELVSHAAMLVIVLIAASGLLGRGPVSHHTQSSPDGTLNVDFESIARHGTATQVTLHIRTDRLTPERPTGLFVSSAFGEPMGLQDTIPRPVGTVAGSAGMTYLFLFSTAEPRALVRFVLKPNAVGPVALRMRVGDSVVAWTQWVVP
jgi:hypothetical protein